MTTQKDGIGWDVGGKFKRKGTYVYLWLTHVNVWQKPTQYCEALILQLKISKLKKKKTHMSNKNQKVNAKGGGSKCKHSYYLLLLTKNSVLSTLKHALFYKLSIQ